MPEESKNHVEKHVIGLDLGGTKLAASLFRVNEEGDSLEPVRSLKPLGYDQLLGAGGKKPPPPVVGEKIKDSMLRMIRELSAETGGVDAVGIATAGFIEGKTLVDASNVGIKMYPLGERVEAEAGARTFLYKDSWAPVFAIAPTEPAIIFSVGTGFGGVSCEPGMEIKILGHTARHRPVWLPVLRKNDDPGYAIAFSRGEIEEILLLSDRLADRLYDRLEACPTTTKQMAAEVRKQAALRGKTVPGFPMYTSAKLLAPEAVAGWRPGEMFADFAGCAAFPAVLYEILTGREIKPEELDRLLEVGDEAAAKCTALQAEFLAAILVEMQRERVEFGLPPARRVYATGSGYNATTHRFLGGAIINAYRRRAADLPPPHPEEVVLVAPPHPDTTLAAAGAAVGAWRGIKIQ